MVQYQDYVMDTVVQTSQIRIIFWRLRQEVRGLALSTHFGYDPTVPTVKSFFHSHPVLLLFEMGHGVFTHC